MAIPGQVGKQAWLGEWPRRRVALLGLFDNLVLKVDDGRVLDLDTSRVLKDLDRLLKQGDAIASGRLYTVTFLAWGAARWAGRSACLPCARPGRPRSSRTIKASARPGDRCPGFTSPSSPLSPSLDLLCFGLVHKVSKTENLQYAELLAGSGLVEAGSRQAKRLG